MPYVRTIWVNDQTKLNADNMNNIEDGIAEAKNEAETAQETADSKVDKIEGKRLSANDYTNTDKQNVEKIPTIEQDIVDLENDKVDKNNTITAGTKTKITYDSKGLVTAGADLEATDIPTLEISKITGLQTALDDKLDKNNAITAGTKTKITYDAKGLVTAGADLIESDIPTLSPSKITQDANNRFVTDNEKSTWNGKQDVLTNVTTAEIVTGTATDQKTVTAKAVHDAIMQIMFDSLGGES